MRLREASFKGTKFHVEETGGQFGRRTVLHEYPFRDLPYGEDLGRAARRFDVTAFFLDKAACDAFIALCEEPGAGTLIHPFYGKAYVQLESPAEVRWPRQQGGRYVVSLRFVEAGDNLEPDAQDDAGGLLDRLIDDALERLGLDFAAAWPSEIQGWLDLADSRLEQVYGFIEQFLSPAEAAKLQLSRLMSGSFLNKPIELFYRISGLWRSAALAAAPFTLHKDLGFATALHPLFQTAAIEEYRATIGAFSDGRVRASADTELLDSLRTQGSRTASGRLSLSAIADSKRARPAWTAQSAGAEVQALPPSLADAVRRVAVLEQVRLLAVETQTGRDYLIAERDRALDLLDAEIHTVSDGLYLAFETVRRQAVAVVAERLPSLREVQVLHTRTALPALVLAYEVNGSIRGYEDLVARNRVRHPCFVPAGKVEVLHDGQ